jgi:DNA-binding transcriptional MerR regulator
MASPPKDRPLPDKPFYKIGEVAEIAGVKPSVLRYWETCFARLRPDKTRANQRIYSKRQLAVVLEVKELLYDRGFTIEGARKHLSRARATAGIATFDGELIEKLKQEVRDLLRLCDE